MISGGLTAAYNALVPEFETVTGNKVLTAYGPSMGTTVNAIPIRLERGEPADVLIMVGYALGDLVKQGKVIADSRVDLVKSTIGIAVKSRRAEAGHQLPRMRSSARCWRRRSIAYSDSASGVYSRLKCFRSSESPTQIKDKARKIPASRSPESWHAVTPRSASSRSAKCCQCRVSISSGPCRRSCRRSPCFQPASSRRPSSPTPVAR